MRAPKLKGFKRYMEKSYFLEAKLDVTCTRKLIGLFDNHARRLLDGCLGLIHAERPNEQASADRQTQTDRQIAISVGGECITFFHQ